MKHESLYPGTHPGPGPSALTQVGLIPGLERLVPGTHDPHRLVRSRFGTFKLPVRYHGREVALIKDGVLLGP